VLRERLGIDDIILVQQQNRWRWYGHVFRKKDTDISDVLSVTYTVLIFSADIQDGDLLRHTYRETTHPTCAIYGVTTSSVVKSRTNRRLKKKQQHGLGEEMYGIWEGGLQTKR